MNRQQSTSATGHSGCRGRSIASPMCPRRSSASRRCGRGRSSMAAYNFDQMSTLRPFRALRPNRADAPRIAAVPYDVVSTDEARALANGNPLSFLRVSRAELELPAGTDPYADAVYRRAADNFASLRKDALTVESDPSVYFYRLEMGSHG